jgi:hypothetical protein
MVTANVNGMFPAGRQLMPPEKYVDVVDYLKSDVPNVFAIAQFHPRNEVRLTECADATWCAQEIVSGRNGSRAVGTAMAVYARRFSQQSYMSRDPLTALTAITVLGSKSVRQTVFDNGMGNEVAACLRTAAAVGLLTQRHAAAMVLGRYAIDAAEDCDASMLLGALSSLNETIGYLRKYRSKLGDVYEGLMLKTLRSVAEVARYVGKNTISTDTMNLLRQVVRMDEVGDVRDSAMKAAAAILAKPMDLPCGSVNLFGPVADSELIKNLIG